MFAEPEQPAAVRCCPPRLGPGGPASSALGPGRPWRCSRHSPRSNSERPRLSAARTQKDRRALSRLGRAGEARRQRGGGGPLLPPLPPTRTGPPSAPTVSESVLRCWKVRAPNTKPESRAEVLSPSMPVMAGRDGPRAGGREPPAAAGGSAAPGPGPPHPEPQGARPRGRARDRSSAAKCGVWEKVL